jgi:hypothetical protein
VRRQEEAKNLQTGFRAKGRKAVGGAGNEEWIVLPHISIIAEVRKNVNLFLPLNSSPTNRIQTPSLPMPGNGCGFAFDRVSAAWDTFCFWGDHDLS